MSENALRGEMSNVPLHGFRSLDHSELIGVLRGLSNSEAHFGDVQVFAFQPDHMALSLQ